jgi:argininosuccinate lyase
VVTDVRLWTRDAIDEVGFRLKEAQRALHALAEANIDVVVPGYTHLQRAQPIMLAHELLAYVEQFERDHARLMDARKRVNQCPLGACALAGTGLDTDRHKVCTREGFRVGDRSRGRFATPTDFPLQDCSPYSHVHVRPER